MNVKPFVDKDYLLEKFESKGGWVYTLIPEIAPYPHTHFGWIYSAKGEQTRIDRMVKTVAALAEHKKFTMNFETK